jgi:hypothetical protein
LTGCGLVRKLLEGLGVGRPASFMDAIWVCPTCTYKNATTGATCEVCDGVDETRQSGSRATSSGAWACAVCTFVNAPVSSTCGMCLQRPVVSTVCAVASIPVAPTPAVEASRCSVEAEATTDVMLLHIQRSRNALKTMGACFAVLFSRCIC